MKTNPRVRLNNSVAYASGSERCVLLSVSLLLSFPCFSVSFRGNASALFSFRVLLLLVLISV